MLALAFTTMTKGGNYSQQWGLTIPSIAFSKLKVSLIFISPAFLTIGSSARIGDKATVGFSPGANDFDPASRNWGVVNPLNRIFRLIPQTGGEIN